MGADASVTVRDAPASPLPVVDAAPLPGPVDATVAEAAAAPVSPTPDVGPQPMGCPAGQQPCATTSGAACFDVTSAGEHCGACGRDCGGGRCLFGHCQPAVVAMGFASRNLVRSSPSFDGKEIYFADYEATGVKAITVADARVRTVVPGERAAGLAVLGDHVYWNQANGDQLSFRRVPRAGGAIEPVATLTRPDTSVGEAYSLQLQDGFLYWFRRETQMVGLIERTRPGSGRVERVASRRPVHGRDGFVVHPTGVYWTDEQTPSIQRSPLAGGAATTFHMLDFEFGGVLAADDRYVYFDGLGYSVGRKPVDGGAAREVGRTSFPLQGAHPLRHGDTMYLFGTVSGGIISWLVNEEGPLRELAGPERDKVGVGVGADDRFLYWVGYESVMWRLRR
jgi:hypothetical protein